MALHVDMTAHFSSCQWTFIYYDMYWIGLFTLIFSFFSTEDSFDCKLVLLRTSMYRILTYLASAGFFTTWTCVIPLSFLLQLLQWQTGYSPRPPTSSDRNQILHGGSLRRVVLRFKFHHNRLSGFRDVWSKSALSLYFGHWLIHGLCTLFDWQTRQCLSVNHCVWLTDVSLPVCQALCLIDRRANVCLSVSMFDWQPRQCLSVNHCLFDWQTRQCLSVSQCVWLTDEALPVCQSLFDWQTRQCLSRGCSGELNCVF